MRFRKKGLSSFYPSGSLSRWLLKNVALGYYQSYEIKSNEFCHGLTMLPQVTLEGFNVG